MVRKNNEKICPSISSKNREYIIKLKLILNNINSIDMKIIIIFVRFKIIPKNDISNKLIATNKYFNKPISMIL